MFHCETTTSCKFLQLWSLCINKTSTNSSFGVSSIHTSKHICPKRLDYSIPKGSAFKKAKIAKYFSLFPRLCHRSSHQLINHLIIPSIIQHLPPPPIFQTPQHPHIHSPVSILLPTTPPRLPRISRPSIPRHTWRLL
jgi:hypothetical protein